MDYWTLQNKKASMIIEVFFCKFSHGKLKFYKPLSLGLLKWYLF